MSTNTKINLLGLTKTQLEAFFVELGEKPFRAGQLMKWMHQFGVDNFDLMTNVSKKLRDRIVELAEIRAPEVVYDKVSEDGTRKWVLQLADGQKIETVFIPEDERGTLCVSSQVGCALDCSFCSTAKQGFNRNLSAAEIIAQVWHAVRLLGAEKTTGARRVTNVVMMGMGEPLTNFEPVVNAMEIMKEDFAYGISRRRLTLSTSGVVPALDRLAEVSNVALAVSLHAPNDELRNTLVPINKKYPLKQLLASCKNYLAKANPTNFLTMEYVMLAGVNDSLEQAEQLALLLKDLPSKINLIPFNPFPMTDYKRSSWAAIEAFAAVLYRHGYTVMVRRTRGDDIDAACGQLVGQVDDRSKRRLIASQAVG